MEYSIPELSSGLLNPEEYMKTKDYLLFSPTNIIKRTDVVIFNLIDSLKSIKNLPEEILLVLRLHPKQDIADIAQSQEFQFISKDEDVTEVCLATDIMVGMSSMIMVEAYELGTNTISLMPRKSEFSWMHQSHSKSIPTFFCKEDFINNIESTISNFDKINQYKHSKKRNSVANDVASYIVENTMLHNINS